MSNSISNNSDDNNVQYEVSFLEIISIFIKYRKFIIIFSLLGFVFSVSSVYLLPKIKKSNQTKKVLVIYSGKIEKPAPDLSAYLNLNVDSLVRSELKNYVNFANVQKKYCIYNSEIVSDRQYNTTVKKILDDGIIKMDYSDGNGVFKIISEVDESKVSLYKDFIVEYVDYCSGLVEENVNGAIDIAKKSLEKILEKQNSINEKSNTKENASLVSLQLAINNYVDANKKIITLVGSPFEADIIIGRGKKVLIITIVVFLISLLLSFVINDIQRIKLDPIASKKIKDAWKAGK